MGREEEWFRRWKWKVKQPDEKNEHEVDRKLRVI